jgi:hypothetical protein
MPILDTLKLARRLEDAGFTNQQATGAAEALSELVFPDVVTKADLQTEIAQLRAELRSENATLRAEIAGVKIAIAQWIVGAMFVNVPTMVGAVGAVWQLAGHRL